MSHQSADLLSAVVSKEMGRLRTLDLAQLVNLPASSERQEDIDGHSVTIVIWHDTLPNGEHRIVVQVSRRILLGLAGAASADGFAVSDSGAKRDLTSDELTSFT